MKTPTQLINNVAHPLSGSGEDYDPMLGLIGDARFVLLGVMTHGTHEFQWDRAQISKHLITEKSFNAVAIEADWPDASRVNRYVKGESRDGDALHALEGFASFPAWMATTLATWR